MSSVLLLFLLAVIFHREISLSSRWHYPFVYLFPLPFTPKSKVIFLSLETCKSLNARTIDNTGAKSLDLSYEVNEFKNICFGWEKYEKELQDSCAVGVQHVRKYVMSRSQSKRN